MTEPAGGNVSFVANGVNAAKNIVATFNEAGTYALEVTITDALNLSVTGMTTVTVSQTLAAVRLSDGNAHAVISPTAPDVITWGGANSLGLMDQTLANLVQSLDADGSISRLDMIQILRSVAANGTLSATDLADLRTIVGADAAKLNMPGYVQVLASDVVNGNAANAHYQGQTLGNLAANSTPLNSTTW